MGQNGESLSANKCRGLFGLLQKDIILGSEGGLGEVIQTLSSQNKLAIVEGLMQLLGKWHIEQAM